MCKEFRPAVENVMCQLERREDVVLTSHRWALGVVIAGVTYYVAHCPGERCSLRFFHGGHPPPDWRVVSDELLQRIGQRRRTLTCEGCTSAAAVETLLRVVDTFSSPPDSPSKGRLCCVLLSGLGLLGAFFLVLSQLGVV